MDVLGEFLIISLAGLAGILLAAIPAFPLPATVTGMIIMLLLLLTGIIKLKQIENVAEFFLRFLPLFFIPLIINLLKESEVFRLYGIKLIIIIISTTIITLTVSGLTAKLMLYILRKGKADDN